MVKIFFLKMVTFTRWQTMVADLLNWNTFFLPPTKKIFTFSLISWQINEIFKSTFLQNYLSTRWGPYCKTLFKNVYYIDAIAENVFDIHINFSFKTIYTMRALLWNWNKDVYGIWIQLQKICLVSLTLKFLWTKLQLYPFFFKI